MNSYHSVFNSSVMKTLNNKFGCLLIVSLLSCLAVYAQHNNMNKGKVKQLNISTIEQVTGMKGKENKGEYKITVPQNDLNVEVDGFKIIPAMGLGSWAAFAPTSSGAMVM